MALDVSSRKEGGGILGFFGSLFGFSKKDNLKSKVMDVIVRLKTQHDKLGDVVYRLESRGRELFDMAVKALESRDLAKATVYAAEVAEIRKIAKAVRAAQLAIERLAIRLETIDVIGDFASILVPAAHVIKDLKQQISGIVPNVAMELEEINHQINSIMIEAGTFSERELMVSVATEEAKKVLEEAAAVAELEIKEKLPELPIGVSTPRIAKQAAVPQQQEQKSKTVTSTKPQSSSLKDAEEAVLEYIKSHRGFLDVSDCAKKYGLTKREVLEALDRLRKKGKIRTGT